MAERIYDYEIWRLQAPLGRTIGDNNCHYDTIGITALRLRTESGGEGWGFGECCWTGVFTRPAWYIESMAPRSLQRPVFERDWWPLLEGHTADQVDSARAAMTTDYFYLDAAVRMALWDLKAKASGVPLYQLLGGSSSTRVRAYGSVLDYPLPEDEAIDLARSFVARGFGAIKVKVGAPDAERDVARLRAIREAVGPHIELTADANETWSAETTLARLEAYQRGGITLGYIEDPLPHDDLAGFSKLMSVTPVPVVGHDYIHTTDEVRWYLAQGLRGLRVGKDVDFSLACAELAKPYGTPLIFGNSLFECNVHLAAALPNVDRLEFSDLGWNALPLNPVRFEDGYAIPPESPGHGLDPKQEVLEQWSCPEDIEA